MHFQQIKHYFFDVSHKAPNFFDVFLQFASKMAFSPAFNALKKSQFEVFFYPYYLTLKGFYFIIVTVGNTPMRQSS